MRANRSCARRSSCTGSTSGFTLLELLVALTLAAIISLCISTVGTQAQRIYETTTAKVEVYQKFRYALDDMERSIQGWIPTTSLEYFIDQVQQNQPGGKNGHWDDGEEIGITGPNLAGGLAGDYDEGAKIFERKYRLENGPIESEHEAYSIYFRTQVEVDGVLRVANVEYFLADPRELADGGDGRIPNVVSDNTNFVLLKTVRYLDVNGENYSSSTTAVRERIVEICPNVTDLRIEYFYDNIFDQKPGTFVTPSTEKLLVSTEREPKEVESDVWMKEFLYGGFSDFTKATATRGQRDYENGVAERPYLQVPPGGRDDVRFSQLGVGAQVNVWSDSPSQFPPGTYTVARNENGRLYFGEEIDTSNWDTTVQRNLRFRAPYAPSSLRISIRVLNDDGREPRTLSITVHPYRSAI